MTSAHSYWIPTNRLVKTCLASYVNEVEYWRQLTGEVVPLYILDSGIQNIEQQNSADVKKIAEQYPCLTIAYVSFGEQKKLVSQIIANANLPASFIEYFVPDSTNYGAVMNKIALLASVVGSEFIHRRDSDTELQQNCPYPLETEMLAFNSAQKIRPTISPAAVGSGYVGEWNMDLKPFLKVSPELFSVFWDCLGVNSSLHDKIYDTLDKGSIDFYHGDQISHTDKNGFHLPDAGNVAFSRLYQLFPNLPSNAMSSDYMLFRFARACGIRILFHRRRVVHEYHSDRGSNVNGYIKSLLKYCDLKPMYAKFEDMVGKISNTNDFDEIRNNQPKYADILNALIEKDTSSRLRNLERFLTEFIASCYPEWARLSDISSESILAECNRDYRNHVDLIMNWENLIDSAKKCQLDLAGKTSTNT